MYQYFLLPSFILVYGICSSIASAQDFSRLGGDLTSNFAGRFVLQLPASNVTDQARFQTMLDGFSVFHAIFTAKEGIGPFFVNNSCGGCHVENGRGPLTLGRSRGGLSALVVKVSLRGIGSTGIPRPVPGIGEVLQPHSERGRNRFELGLKWRMKKGKYPDGTQYELRSPLLQFRVRDTSSRKILSSLRMTPGIIGTGLLESISEQTLLELSDPEDANGDGVSGRPNYVLDRNTSLIAIGRFGFKGAQPTVEQQSLAALASEMGLTNRLFPDVSGKPNAFPDSQISPLVTYQKIAGVPSARNQATEKGILGRDLFKQIGCADCHRMTVRTSSSADPELANQEIHPFSDLLLHDMGPGLADRRPEGLASGFEWRTTPLWGLGFLSTVSRVKQFFLHDGRARTIEEAILWHGGEAKRSQEKFVNLPKDSRIDLITFLESL